MYPVGQRGPDPGVGGDPSQAFRPHGSPGDPDAEGEREEFVS